MSTNPLPFVGFADDACHSTQNLSFDVWELFDPNDELVILQGTCLGHTTNNIVEYSAVIELFSEAIALGIRVLVVKLDSQLIVLQLNKHYSVRNPNILRMYLRVCLLEINFDYITYLLETMVLCMVFAHGFGQDDFRSMVLDASHVYICIVTLKGT